MALVAGLVDENAPPNPDLFEIGRDLLSYDVGPCKNVTAIVQIASALARVDETRNCKARPRSSDPLAAFPMA